MSRKTSLPLTTLSPLLLILFLCSGLAFAEDQPVLQGVRHTPLASGGEEVVLQLNGAHRPNIQMTQGAHPKIILDFVGMTQSKAVNNTTPARGPQVQRIRVGMHTDGGRKTRVVVDLAGWQGLQYTEHFDERAKTLTLKISVGQGVANQANAGQAGVEKTTTATTGSTAAGAASGTENLTAVKETARQKAEQAKAAAKKKEELAAARKAESEATAQKREELVAAKREKAELATMKRAEQEAIAAAKQAEQEAAEARKREEFAAAQQEKEALAAAKRAEQEAIAAAKKAELEAVVARKKVEQEAAKKEKEAIAAAKKMELEAAAARKQEELEAAKREKKAIAAAKRAEQAATVARKKAEQEAAKKEQEAIAVAKKAEQEAAASKKEALEAVKKEKEKLAAAKKAEQNKAEQDKAVQAVVQSSPASMAALPGTGGGAEIAPTQQVTPKLQSDSQIGAQPETAPAGPGATGGDSQSDPFTSPFAGKTAGTPGSSAGPADRSQRKDPFVPAISPPAANPTEQASDEDVDLAAQAEGGEKGGGSGKIKAKIAIAKEQGQDAPNDQSQPSATLGSTPTEPFLESVTFDDKSPKGEMVIFKLNGFYPPLVHGAEEGTPSVVCDFADADMDKAIKSLTRVKGKNVRAIRLTQTKRPKKIRAVVELERGKNYDLQQVFFKDDRLFVLIVNEVR